MDKDKKKIFIRSWGCQMNVRDSEVICGLLKNTGYVIAEDPDKADIVLFNTCSVRQHAEDKVWSEIGRFKGQSPSGTVFKGKETLGTVPFGKHSRALTGTVPIIGLVGCMAQEHKEKIFERVPQVDFVVGPNDIDKIPEIIKKVTSHRLTVGKQDLFELKIWETDGEVRPEEIYRTGFYEDKSHAYVVISEGCSNFCSYCVVPYVRGNLKNRNYQDILREIEEAVDKGITKITLLGQNVNAYVSNSKLKTLPPSLSEAQAGSRPNMKSLSGKSSRINSDGEINFVDLLKMVNDINGLKEFSFITSHPKDTSQELFKAMAELEKLKKYLHLPVQSGSDRILKLMNRSYSKKFYLDLIGNYRKMVKNGILTTDIIVGFPTETEGDFQDTYNLVKDVQFNAAYIFKYSSRLNTEAANLVDDVAKEEKERRHRLILELQKGISKSVR